jgi:hypothetical protein
MHFSAIRHLFADVNRNNAGIQYSVLVFSVEANWVPPVSGMMVDAAPRPGMSEAGMLLME